MTRLANSAKAGYFPIPPAVTDLITTYIAAPQNGRILDPCAGEGTALVALAEKLHLTPYGVELHQERAQKAKEAIHHFFQPCPPQLETRNSKLETSPPQLETRNSKLETFHLLHDSYQNLVTNKGGFNLLYENPPYDHDDQDGRLEYQWLVHTRQWLQPGGLLIWVVPRHLLGMKKAARYLTSYYQDVQVYRFPDGSYSQFKQVVLFGVHRSNPVPPDNDLVERLVMMSSELFEMSVLSAVSEPLYTLPPLQVKETRFKFHSIFINPQDALAEARSRGVSTSPAWREHLDASQIHLPLRPLTPLKIGHMNSIIAAGFLNNQLLAEGEERLLIKGRSYKTTRHETLEEPLPGGKTRLTDIETEVVVTDITSVDGQGHITRYKGLELEKFLQQWLSHLTRLVAEQYSPLYQFNLNGYGELLHRLSLSRRIPGMNGQTGLLPAQKHAAAAALTRLENHRETIVVGEMGTGKAQPLNSKVLTPRGWKQMGEIQVGDEVVNPEGGTAYVVSVYPQGKKDIYRITFSDGAQTECCDEHLWQVTTPERKWRQHSAKVQELSQLRHKLFSESGNARYFIPIVNPVEFVEKSLPLDPYLLGLLIGDGGLTGECPTLTSADEEVIEVAKQVLPGEVTLKYQGKYGYRMSGEYKRSSNGRFVASNPVTIALRELGLMGHRAESKFIPKLYLFADTQARIALLQGLLDTDGSFPKKGHAGPMEYCTVSQQLVQDVRELVWSLGGTARITLKQPSYTHQGESRVGQLAYRLFIRLPNHIQPFRLSRKLACIVPYTKYGIHRAMVQVEYVGQKEAQCIALDSENQLYVTDDYIVTHNTTVGAAIAAGRKAHRTIILCPPHLVDKWQRECKAVWPRVRTLHLQSPADVDFFFNPHQPDDAPLVGVLKQTTARAASGWEHAYNYGGPASHCYGSNGFDAIQRIWGKVLAWQQMAFMTEEERPFTPKQLQTLLARGMRCPVCGNTQLLDGRPMNPDELKAATRRCTNPACRSPLYQFTRRRTESQPRGSFALYAQQEKLIRESLSVSSRPSPFAPPSSLFPPSSFVPHPSSFPSGYAKTPLAGYIKKRARGKLDLLLIDEAHEYKGDDSDQGYSAHHLALAARKVVALTGTIYGGKASSLFHLLFRMAPDMQKTYVDHQERGLRRLKQKEWVSSYGILQQIETRLLDENGKQTANGRSNTRFKELPGSSLSMLPWLLNRSVFLSLQDMGFPLPEYREIPVSVEMAPEQAVLYEALKTQLKEELKERLLRGDKSLLSAYLYALLFWPDSPRRGKVVTCPRSGQVVASIPGLPAEFRGPKEARIIQLCQQEKTAGRKVLLFCQQTDTLDITQEWKGMLEAAGLKTAVLRADPSKREAWVEKQVAAGIDVLITHPKKVQTGLDLLQFPTLIWMSIDYSVYTVLQASRRSWRIGQTEPVKVYFFSYGDTIQEDALRLVAAKVAAALRVNGDTVGDGTLAELDSLTSGDLIATLAKIVIGETKLEAKSLQQAFAEANASLKQANTIIGEYTMVENGIPEPETLTHSEAQQVMEAAVAQETNPAQTLTAGLLDALERVKQAVIVDENGQVVRQPSLFTHVNGRKPNGNGRSHPHANGHTVNNSLLPPSQPANGNGHPPKDTPSTDDDTPTPPPVPRPRLLRSLLQVG